MMWFYLLGLCVSIGGLALLDYRYKLAFWHDARQSAWTIGVAVAIFIVWDILGIILGIFFHGNSPWTLPLHLLPEFPVEEIFFLILLCYVTLQIYRSLERKC